LSDGPARKKRTRQHVIADLSANHVERHALLCGFSVERVVHDYGIDLVLFTYDANGEIENGQVFLQLKATDSPTILQDGRRIAFPVSRSDLELWLNEPMPCILLAEAGSMVTIHVPRTNVVDDSAIRKFARFRDDVLRQLNGVIRHHGE